MTTSPVSSRALGDMGKAFNDSQIRRTVKSLLDGNHVALHVIKKHQDLVDVTKDILMFQAMDFHDYIPQIVRIKDGCMEEFKDRLEMMKL